MFFFIIFFLSFLNNFLFLFNHISNFNTIILPAAAGPKGDGRLFSATCSTLLLPAASPPSKSNLKYLPPSPYSLAPGGLLFPIPVLFFFRIRCAFTRSGPRRALRRVRRDLNRYNKTHRRRSNTPSPPAASFQQHTRNRGPIVPGVSIKPTPPG